jgi:MFS family permease
VLSRPFVALYVAVFVATMGISMVSPLLPVYARDLGASGVWLGLTFSIFAIVQTFVGPFSGRLSDRYGRKPFIAAGLIVYMIAALGYLTAQSFVQVLAFRAFSGLGTSLVFSVARAYVGDLTPRGHEGRWAGVFATADIIGFGTGPLVAGAFRQLLGFHSVFVAMAVLMATSAMIVMIFLPSRASQQRQRLSRAASETSIGFRAALRDRLVIALLANQTLISLGSGASFSFLALRLEDDLHVAPLLIGLAFATQDLTGGFAQPFFGRLADRRNRSALVAIGLAANGALLFTLALAQSYGLVVAILFGMGATGALSGVSAGAIQVVAGRRVGMGTLLGLSSAGNGLGIVTGSLSGGVLIDLFDIRAAFVFGGIVIVAGSLVFLALARGQQTTDTGHVVAFEPAAEAAPAGL